MAIIKNGILGGFSGKVGTAVGYQIGNVSYIRALPIRRAKPTKNELINRAKFKLVQDTLQPLKDLLKVGFKNYGTKTGGYRSAASYTRKIALVQDSAGFYIDPALLKISGGDLPQALNPTVVLENPTHIKFSWDTDHIPYEHASDQSLLLVYDIESKVCITRIFNGAFRKDGTQTVEIPIDFKGKAIEIYIGFVSDDRSMQSDSQYLGQINVPA